MKMLLALTLLILPVSSAHGYVIDGDVSDWNVLLNVPAAQTKGYLDTHTPSGGQDIDFVTEDNADKNSGTFFVGPGYTTGNRYDAEAMYFDNDASRAYLAIITGVSPAETEFPAGDIFIDIGKYQDPLSLLYDPKKYEFAIHIETSQLYRVGDWENVLYLEHAASNPWTIGDDDSKNALLGDVEFVFGGPVNTHYTLESSFDLSLLGLSAKENHDVWLHWTMYCGNDTLNLHADINAVPEPGTLAMLSTGLLGLIGWHRKRS